MLRDVSWQLERERSGTMVTSVPWERERDITVVAVLATLQPSGVQYPILT